MREILFKAKCINNDEWVEGFYLKRTSVFGKIEHRIFYEVENGYEFEPVIPETLCQYTGFTDKNGQKIWENDIAHYHGTHDDICVIRYGEYNNNSRNHHIGFYTDWKTFDFMFRQDLGFWVDERELEVIGNIFDNPKFME